MVIDNTCKLISYLFFITTLELISSQNKVDIVAHFVVKCHYLVLDVSLRKNGKHNFMRKLTDICRPILPLNAFQLHVNSDYHNILQLVADFYHDLHSKCCSTIMYMFSLEK